MSTCYDKFINGKCRMYKETEQLKRHVIYRQTLLLIHVVHAYSIEACTALTIIIILFLRTHKLNLNC